MPFLFCNANEQASKLRKFKTRRTHLPYTRATSIAKDYAAKWMFCIWKSNVSGRGLLTLENLKMSDPLTVAVERDNLSKLQVLEIRYLGFQGFEGVKYTDCSGQCPTHPLSWSLLQKYHQASLTVLFSAGVKWIDCFRWHTMCREGTRRHGLLAQKDGKWMGAIVWEVDLELLRFLFPKEFSSPRWS